MKLEHNFIERKMQREATMGDFERTKQAKRSSVYNKAFQWAVGNHIGDFSVHPYSFKDRDGNQIYISTVTDDLGSVLYFEGRCINTSELL